MPDKPLGSTPMGAGLGHHPSGPVSDPEGPFGMWPAEGEEQGRH